MIWREIRELVAVKPVVVSMGAGAASGGYYIAAPATKILAETTTIRSVEGQCDYATALNIEVVSNTDEFSRVCVCVCVYYCST
jgi:hypothetical protein